MRRDDLNDLVAFLAVADERSFTRAAVRPEMSPSALSHAMKGLERRLGLRLLARTTRSVAPTEAGERLLGTLRPAFDDIGAGLTAIGEPRDKPAGTVRVAASKHSATTTLAGPTGLFPRVPRGPRRGDGRRRGDRPRGGPVRRRAPDRRAGGGDMVPVRVGPDLRLAVVGSPGFFAERAAPSRPQDLADLPCIGYRMAPEDGLCLWAFVEDGRTFRVKVAGRLVLNDVELLMSAALAGQRIAHFDEDMVADHVAAGRLVRVLADWCPPFSGYYLYHPSRRQPPPALVAALRCRATAR